MRKTTFRCDGQDEYDMLVEISGNVSKLETQGNSLTETISTGPTAAYDATWGQFLDAGDIHQNLSLPAFSSGGVYGDPPSRAAALSFYAATHGPRDSGGRVSVIMQDSAVDLVFAGRLSEKHFLELIRHEPLGVRSRIRSEDFLHCGD